MYKIIQYIASDNVIRSMKKLYPKWEIKRKLFEFYLSKLKLCFLVLVVGILISIYMSFSSSKGSILLGEKIRRNDYNSGIKKVKLQVETDDGISHNKNNGEKDFRYCEDIEINISEKKYPDVEISKMAQSALGELNKIMISSNDSFDHVTANLNFVKRIDGYPFDISYRTDRPLILSRDGVINYQNFEDSVRDNNDKEIVVEIIVTFTYMDYKEDNILYACICEKELTEEEKFEKELDGAIEKANLNTIENDFFYLPKSVNGYDLLFTEKDNNSSITIMVLTLVAAIFIFFAKDKDLEKELENRDRELIIEYPRLLNKFTLFFNAGMPIKLIWNKLCDDYITEYEVSKKKNYLYEEMLITRAQILDGKREIDAYEEFANRIGIPCYRVFISLIEQAIKVGKKDLSMTLRKESEEAFIRRKNNAKQLFEEAGTKLLVPMFMMLCIVIVIIMFPAFYSFKM